MDPKDLIAAVAVSVGFLPVLFALFDWLTKSRKKPA